MVGSLFLCSYESSCEDFFVVAKAPPYWPERPMYRGKWMVTPSAQGLTRGVTIDPTIVASKMRRDEEKNWWGLGVG